MLGVSCALSVEMPERYSASLRRSYITYCRIRYRISRARPLDGCKVEVAADTILPLHRHGDAREPSFMELLEIYT